MKTLKKPTRGGPRTGAGRPGIPPHLRRVQITPQILPVTQDRLAALILMARDLDGHFPSLGEMIDRLAEQAHPELPDA